MINLLIILSLSASLVVFQMSYILIKYKPYAIAWMGNKSIWNADYDRLRLISNILFFGISSYFFILIPVDSKIFRYSIFHTIFFYIVPVFIGLFTYLIYLNWSKKINSKPEIIAETILLETDKNNEIIGLKKLSKEQNILLFNFLSKWFKVSTQDNIQNLIDLNLSSLKGKTELIKSVKSLSLLFFKLNENDYYSRQQIESIFDSSKIVSHKSLLIDKDVLSKHFSNFSKGNYIDCDKEKENIYLLIKSF